MLLHQGAAAFTLWTGQPAPLELMQDKLAEARAGGLRSAEGEATGVAADDWLARDQAEASAPPEPSPKPPRSPRTAAAGPRPPPPARRTDRPTATTRRWARSDS